MAGDADQGQDGQGHQAALRWWRSCAADVFDLAVGHHHRRKRDQGRDGDGRGGNGDDDDREPPAPQLAHRAVSGLPTTSARAVPTYTAVVARPACVAGTRRTPIGAITDHINACVSAHSTRHGRTAKFGATSQN